MAADREISESLTANELKEPRINPLLVEQLVELGYLKPSDE